MRASLVAAGLLLYCGTAALGENIPREIRTLIPARFDIDSPRMAFAKRELLNAIRSCGEGVVRGAMDSEGKRAQNRCSYEIELDELFFTPLKKKTGLLHDDDWAYRDGETWWQPREEEIPDTYDIRDLMKAGMPDLRQQKCGDCWAWATHHGLELARAVFDQKVYDHSVQTVLSCSGHGSCNGGYMSTPTWLVNRGLPNEPEFPYAASDTKCKFNSSQLAQGWEGAIHDAPSIGSSLDYSRYHQHRGVREGQKVKNIMAAIYQAKSPAVVTVAAYSISGDGIYNSCSSINSGGNHMVTIVGWDKENGKRNAHVWNSWGKSHGKEGVSRIQWECGDGKLNRGLGVSARIIHYAMPCKIPSLDSLAQSHRIREGGKLRLGRKMTQGTECKWLPSDGLTDPNACETEANPKVSTEYHLQVKSTCGTKSAMVLVELFNNPGTDKKKLLTPFGEIDFEEEN